MVGITRSKVISNAAPASLGRFAMPSTPTDDVAEAVISAQQILVKRSATESCKKRYLISDWTEGSKGADSWQFMILCWCPWFRSLEIHAKAHERFQIIEVYRTHSQEQFERRFLWRKLFKMPWPLRERFCEKVVKGEFREPLLSPTLAWRTVNYKMILKEHEGLICITMMLTMTMMRVSHSYSNDFSGVYTVSIVDYVPLGSYWNRFWKSQMFTTSGERLASYGKVRIIGPCDGLFIQILWKIVGVFFFWEVGKRINFRRVSSNWPRMLRSSFQPKPSTSWPWAEFSLLQDVGFLSSKCYEGPGIPNGPFSLSQLFFDVFFLKHLHLLVIEMCFRVSCCSQVGLWMHVL